MRGSVTCLLNCLLYIFWEALFSQMNNLCSDGCLCFEMLVCEIAVSLQMPHRTLTMPIIIGLIHVWVIGDWMHRSLLVDSYANGHEDMLIGLDSRCVIFSEAYLRMCCLP